MLPNQNRAAQERGARQISFRHIQLNHTQPDHIQSNHVQLSIFFACVGVCVLVYTRPDIFQRRETTLY